MCTRSVDVKVRHANRTAPSGDNNVDIQGEKHLIISYMHTHTL